MRFVHALLSTFSIDRPLALARDLRRPDHRLSSHACGRTLVSSSHYSPSRERYRRARCALTSRWRPAPGSLGKGEADEQSVMCQTLPSVVALAAQSAHRRPGQRIVHHLRSLPTRRLQQFRDAANALPTATGDPCRRRSKSEHSSPVGLRAGCESAQHELRHEVVLSRPLALLQQLLLVASRAHGHMLAAVADGEIKARRRGE